MAVEESVGGVRWALGRETRSIENVLSPHAAAFSDGGMVPVGPQHVIQLRPQRVSADGLRAMLADRPHDAARWIEAAAKSGLQPAQVVWGQLLLDGHGVMRDVVAAFSWFQMAAANGDSEALNMVGRCYEQGWGVAPDPNLAIASFERAALDGHLWARVNLAQMLMRTGNPAHRPRCFALFKAVAKGGTSKANLKAMNSLARFLEEGWVGPPDPAGAVSWYIKAAQLGDHWAQYNLATILYRHGDTEIADQWLRRAILGGDNGFRRRIAPLLLEQSELAHRQCGLDALERIAASREPDDLYAFAVALHTGVAGPSDPKRAVALFKVAAAKGHTGAARRLRERHSLARLIDVISRGLGLTWVSANLSHLKGVS